jgi:hypothetical protein
MYKTEKHPVTPGEKARGYYVAAIALTENADPVRPQIAHEPIHHLPLRQVAL